MFSKTSSLRPTDEGVVTLFEMRPRGDAHHDFVEVPDIALSSAPCGVCGAHNQDVSEGIIHVAVGSLLMRGISH
ncbi:MULTISPECIES: hypothetical protein [unclassified Mesorhizobium]|uniref:hypothetical protein n=1 Tax=unclassified Mesorhizobium TaxID=325217 RepID=UPI0033375D78